MYSQPLPLQLNSQQPMPYIYNTPIPYGYGIQNPLIQNFYKYPQVPSVVNFNLHAQNSGFPGEREELFPKNNSSPTATNIQEPLRVPFDLLNSCKSNKESKLLNERTSKKVIEESKHSSSVSSA